MSTSFNPMIVILLAMAAPIVGLALIWFSFCV